MQNSIANSVKKVWKFLIKLNIYYLAHNPAILFIDIYSREIKTYIHTKTCIWILCCCSVSQSRQSLCDPMDCSMPGFPVYHHLLDLAQTHVIELVMPSNHLILCHPLLILPLIFPSIRVFYQWVSSSNQVAKVLELQLFHYAIWQCYYCNPTLGYKDSFVFNGT